MKTWLKAYFMFNVFVQINWKYILLYTIKIYNQKLKYTILTILATFATEYDIHGTFYKIN